MSTAPTGPLDYALVDVFAERRLEGNQLAIFTDARGLSDESMQALAREMNLAETTFILPADDPAEEVAQGVRVRIFTVEEELPFAGHPTLGTAAWIRSRHPLLQGAGEITLRLKAGPITVRYEAQAAEDREGVFGTMRQLDPVFGAVHSRDEVAGAIGMSVEDLDPHLQPQTVSTGMPFCVVALRSMEAIGRLQIPQAAAQTWLAAHGAKFFYCVARCENAAGTDGAADWHARMQFYNGEDPATGSGCGCAIAYLVRHGAVGSGRPSLFEQGVEIRRPARMYVRATKTGDGVSQVFVGGRTITVASGSFFRV